MQVAFWIQSFKKLALKKAQCSGAYVTLMAATEGRSKMKKKNLRKMKVVCITFYCFILLVNFQLVFKAMNHIRLERDLGNSTEDYEDEELTDVGEVKKNKGNVKPRLSRAESSRKSLKLGKKKWGKPKRQPQAVDQSNAKKDYSQHETNLDNTTVDHISANEPKNYYMSNYGKQKHESVSSNNSRKHHKPHFDQAMSPEEQKEYIGKIGKSKFQRHGPSARKPPNMLFGGGAENMEQLATTGMSQNEKEELMKMKRPPFSKEKNTEALSNIFRSNQLDPKTGNIPDIDLSNIVSGLNLDGQYYEKSTTDQIPEEAAIQDVSLMRRNKGHMKHNVERKFRGSSDGKNGPWNLELDGASAMPPIWKPEVQDDNSYYKKDGHTKGNGDHGGEKEIHSRVGSPPHRSGQGRISNHNNVFQNGFHRHEDSKIGQINPELSERFREGHKTRSHFEKGNKRHGKLGESESEAYYNDQGVPNMHSEPENYQDHYPLKSMSREGLKQRGHPRHRHSKYGQAETEVPHSERELNPEPENYGLQRHGDTKLGQRNAELSGRVREGHKTRSHFVKGNKIHGKLGESESEAYYNDQGVPNMHSEPENYHDQHPMKNFDTEDLKQRGNPHNRHDQYRQAETVVPNSESDPNPELENYGKSNGYPKSENYGQPNGYPGHENYDKPNGYSEPENDGQHQTKTSDKKEHIVKSKFRRDKSRSGQSGEAEDEVYSHGRKSNRANGGSHEYAKEERFSHQLNYISSDKNGPSNHTLGKTRKQNMRGSKEEAEPVTEEHYNNEQYREVTSASSTDLEDIEHLNSQISTDSSHFELENGHKEQKNKKMKDKSQSQGRMNKDISAKNKSDKKGVTGHDNSNHNRGNSQTSYDPMQTTNNTDEIYSSKNETYHKPNLTSEIEIKNLKTRRTQNGTSYEYDKIENNNDFVISNGSSHFELENGHKERKNKKINDKSQSQGRMNKDIRAKNKSDKNGVTGHDNSNHNRGNSQTSYYPMQTTNNNVDFKSNLAYQNQDYSSLASQDAKPESSTLYVSPETGNSNIMNTEVSNMAQPETGKVSSEYQRSEQYHKSMGEQDNKQERGKVHNKQRFRSLSEKQINALEILNLVIKAKNNSKLHNILKGRIKNDNAFVENLLEKSKQIDHKEMALFLQQQGKSINTKIQREHDIKATEQEANKPSGESSNDKQDRESIKDHKYNDSVDSSIHENYGDVDDSKYESGKHIQGNKLDSSNKNIKEHKNQGTLTSTGQYISTYPSYLGTKNNKPSKGQKDLVSQNMYNNTVTRSNPPDEKMQSYITNKESKIDDEINNYNSSSNFSKVNVSSSTKTSTSNLQHDLKSKGHSIGQGVKHNTGSAKGKKGKGGKLNGNHHKNKNGNWWNVNRPNGHHFRQGDHHLIKKKHNFGIFNGETSKNYDEQHDKGNLSKMSKDQNQEIESTKSNIHNDKSMITSSPDESTTIQPSTNMSDNTEQIPSSKKKSGNNKKSKTTKNTQKKNSNKDKNEANTKGKANQRAEKQTQSKHSGIYRDDLN